MKKNTRTNLMLGILLALLLVAYKMLFMAPAEMSQDSNMVASVRVDAILKQIDAINFDTSIFQDPKLRSLNSLEAPLPNLPVGKSNPFAN